MALPPGKRLGPYEILSLLGEGGMGEVYKARDTRLDRIVAVKVLPAHLAERPDLRERFEREARTIANLNHPHICILYDIGQQDGTDFLVMEYLEGDTLAHRLLKGPLPLDLVLRYAVELADALDKAHHKAITHRDIKPSNIMLTRDGTKLLDFGLAKLKQEAAQPDLPPSQVPTAGASLTLHGVLMGTPQYMAPEQVEGKVEEVDARTDLFAFGVVVYEMTTGKKAFEAKSQAGLIGAILKDNPPSMSSLQPMTPLALDRVVKRCLAKDPEDRWQTARDLCRDLQWIAEAGEEVAKPSTANGRRRTVLAALALLLAAITGVIVWNLKSVPAPPAQQITRFTLTLPPGQQLASLSNPVVAISPDGTRLAYVARSGGAAQQIYLRPLDSLESKPLPDTEGAVNPFFSPDGQWLGFFANSKLKKVSINGGTAQLIADTVITTGAAWGTDDRIFFGGFTNGTFQVAAAGGNPELVIPPKGDPAQGWPDILPGGKVVLYTAPSATSNWDNSRLIALRLDTGERRTLFQGATNARYLPTGHLIYARGGKLMAVRFDPERLEITGPFLPVVENVTEFIRNGSAQFSVSRAGSLVYLPGGLQATQDALVWVDRKGTAKPLGAPLRPYVYQHLSPGGQRVAVTLEGDIWVYDVTRDTLTRLTFDGSNDLPRWTPDGKRIVFRSVRGQTFNLFWKPADGSGREERLMSMDHAIFPAWWSPDGKLLAYVDNNSSTQRDLWVLPLEGDRKPRPLIRTPFNESAPVFSPDGRWLAYVSDESGRFEIYVQPYPGPGGKWQISTDGGTEPLWARNGELFYRDDSKMMVVETTTQPSFTASKPRVLFDGPYEKTTGTLAFYDASADGQRFLMLKPSESDQGATQINVVLNWFEELKRKVPVK